MGEKKITTTGYVRLWCNAGIKTQSLILQSSAIPYVTTWGKSYSLWTM